MLAPAIETDLSRDQDAELTAQFYKVAPYWKTPDEGSSTTLVAALDPSLNGTSGNVLIHVLVGADTICRSEGSLLV